MTVCTSIDNIPLPLPHLTDVLTKQRLCAAEPYMTRVSGFFEKVHVLVALKGCYMNTDVYLTIQEAINVSKSVFSELYIHLRLP